MTDSSFNSEEEAKVRLEASGSSYLFEGYSGVDLFVYKVPNPIEFLKEQKNLHRPSVKGNFTGEGLQNVFNYLWDVGYKKSRLVWQRIISTNARKQLTEELPELKQLPPHTYKTKFKNHPQYKPLKEFKLVDKFRYPFLDAQPIGPPKGINLSGSSSNFIKIKKGNVYVPIGKRNPGLYFVEAIIGEYRASTVVFISNTVAISKNSKNYNFIWAINKITGQASPETEIHLTDGVGTISSGVTDKNGILIIDKTLPEHTYIIGESHDGGVFVSENYYYSSEINDLKLYAFTDRPIYKPGDLVHLKVLGLNMKEPKKPALLSPGEMRLVLLDQNSTPILTKDLELAEPALGAEVDFKLPKFSSPGGYSVQIKYQGKSFASAFRVNSFIKPHYEIDILLDKNETSLNKKITGLVKLSFANGLPVVDAKVELNARVQKLTMVDGELHYQGLFPLQIFDSNVRVSEDGSVKFELPEVSEPSRFIIYAKATDGSGYAVTAKKEILIEEGLARVKIESDGRISTPGRKVTFKIIKHKKETTDILKWEAVRLEDQKLISGQIAVNGEKFKIKFITPGSYTINLKNTSDIILATLSHWVQGDGLQSTPGSVSLISDRTNYKEGDIAHILMTFPEEISQALVTLERDKVEKSGLITHSHDWIKFDKKSDKQWIASIPITESFKPNIIFSVAYILNGQFYFQNKGLQIKPNEIEIAVDPNKKSYLPGETVTVNFETTLDGNPHSSVLTVSVVDEMVYMIQPEIAPKITDFFYHPKRNQVRTSSSLNFHTYDAAVPPTSFGPNYSSYNERGLKPGIQERPRRENTDTAFWATNIRTDSNGKGQVSFVMPESLARWRITIRAIDDQGGVGQKKSFITSAQDFYLTWVGPKVFRSNDAPEVNLIAFNLKNDVFQSEIRINGLGVATKISKQLKPGPNYLNFKLSARTPGKITADLHIKDQVVDSLETDIAVIPQNWLTTRSNSFKFDQVKSLINIPGDSFNVRLGLSRGFSGHFIEAADKLISYPYGCVEQTASKLIPLSLAYEQIKKVGLSSNVFSRLTSLMENSRLRIIQMAGPRATFNWWGDLAEGSPFLTSYAYYADWIASKSLGIETSENQWNSFFDVYNQKSSEESLFLNAASLYLANKMGLPVQTLLERLAETGKSMHLAKLLNKSNYLYTSYALPLKPNILSDSLAIVLVKVTAQDLNIPLSVQFLQSVDIAKINLKTTDNPLAKALMILEDSQNGVSSRHKDTLDKILINLISDMPTIDRSLGLVFLNNAVSNKNKEGFYPERIYQGSIDEKHEIEMSLVRKGKLISGSYFYKHVGTTINLVGQITQDEGFILKESINGEQTGTFKGRFMINGEITGTWEKVGVKKYLPFRLKPKTAVSEVEIIAGTDWIKRETRLGRPLWQFKGSSKETNVQFNGFPGKSVYGHLTYDSFKPEKHSLPIRIERELYRLEKGPESEESRGRVKFKATALGKTLEAKSSDLYIDEIRITPEGGGGSFGIIEIPIPPGSRVEKQYLNLNITEFEKSSFRHKVIFDEGNLYYSIPIESLEEPVIFRSFVRFSQRGEFILPRARFYKMYSPNDKAFADENKPQYKKILVN